MSRIVLQKIEGFFFMISTWISTWISGFPDFYLSDTFLALYEWQITMESDGKFMIIKNMNKTTQ